MQHNILGSILVPQRPYQSPQRGYSYTARCLPHDELQPHIAVLKKRAQGNHYDYLGLLLSHYWVDNEAKMRGDGLSQCDRPTPTWSFVQPF